MTESDDGETRAAMIELPEKTFFKIGEVAKLLEVEPYVLRYWETEFEVLEPKKTKSGQRVYQRDDIELLLQIRSLLYEEMFTIAGARRQLARSREGKPSYFDIKDGASRPKGTAVAGEEELRQELESARQELVMAHTELSKSEEALDAAREMSSKLGQESTELRRELEMMQVELEDQSEAPQEGLVDELQEKIASLTDRLQAKQKEVKEQKMRHKRKRREHSEERRRVLGSLRGEVESLAELAHAGSRRFR